MYRVPGDEEFVTATFTRGDLDIIHNALCFYGLWLREKGSLPVEHGVVSEAQERVLATMRRFNVSDEQLVTRLKDAAISHVDRLKGLFEEVINDGPGDMS